MSRRPDRSLGVSRGLQQGIRQPSHSSFRHMPRWSLSLGAVVKACLWAIALAWLFSMIRGVIA